jgi:SAM-dependent methyltransferase
MNIKQNSNEGLGTVYERFMLNVFFDKLIDTYGIKDVLEIPLRGMTGLTGINSVHFAERNCNVTLVDPNKASIAEAIDLFAALPYKDKCHFLYQQNLSQLPFPDRSFDLVWNFSALWHIANAKDLLAEMARVSSNLVLVFVTNKVQIGYYLRKYLLDPAFFQTIHEKWTDIDQVNTFFSSQGLRLVAQGVLDVPPWPDTCLPIGKILGKLKSQSKKRKIRKASKSFWTWDIMEYYLGRNTSLKKTVTKLSFLERMPIPWQLKTFWAHHRYSIFAKS